MKYFISLVIFAFMLFALSSFYCTFYFCGYSDASIAKVLFTKKENAARALPKAKSRGLSFVQHVIDGDLLISPEFSFPHHLIYLIGSLAPDKIEDLIDWANKAFDSPRTLHEKYAALSVLVMLDDAASAKLIDDFIMKHGAGFYPDYDEISELLIISQYYRNDPFKLLELMSFESISINYYLRRVIADALQMHIGDIKVQEVLITLLTEGRVGDEVINLLAQVLDDSDIESMVKVFEIKMNGGTPGFLCEKVSTGKYSCGYK
ncbi:hypothetical protein VT06_16550 [Arsukibacterium sp. MJ3]|uniref:hypothetical protein n=1 Tax=Arsukibacterium sp. MJ3 TaxID=1632859 RepID=UPI0006270B24|nr:hypothetical protein [Arsukibacterium sp. MJ3]KKO47536.1 hypothetical protein VT06_16550 [Arsukibacterium sp. MJ3]